MLTILLLSLAAFQAPPAAQPELPPGVERVGRDVSAPVALLQPAPAYPDAARAAGTKGEVRLRCIIDEKGVPTSIVVVKSLTEDLDKSAIEAVSKWRFKPSMKYGLPVSVQVLIDVTFNAL